MVPAAGLTNTNLHLGPRVALRPYCQLHTATEGSLPAYIAESGGAYYYWVCSADLTVIAWGEGSQWREERDIAFEVLGSHAVHYNNYALLRC